MKSTKPQAPVLLRAPSAGDEPALLDLNAASIRELSPLTLPELRRLVSTAFRVRVAGAAEGFCIALDQRAAYDSPNFDWFCSRFDRFVYVDRVVVSAAARGKGIARALYLDLIDAAADLHHTMVCCEVNLDPPNPSSDVFHAALGFSEIGRAYLAERSKTVRYLRRQI